MIHCFQITSNITYIVYAVYLIIIVLLMYIPTCIVLRYVVCVKMGQDDNSKCKVSTKQLRFPQNNIAAYKCLHTINTIRYKISAYNCIV